MIRQGFFRRRWLVFLLLLSILLLTTWAIINAAEPRDEISAVVIFASATGKSLVEDADKIVQAETALTLDEIKAYFAHPGTVEEASESLSALGFEVLARDPLAAVVRGPKLTFEKVFNTGLVERSQKVRIGRTEREITCYSPSKPVSIPPHLLGKIETILFPVPVELYQSPPEDPPSLPYYHLVVPQDISRVIGADGPHEDGITGDGVKVTMIDSGFYMHPYYLKRGYDITQDAVFWWDETTDPVGHGTAIASNVLAVAPGIQLTSIKALQAPPIPILQTSEIIAAFIKANKNGAQVITNSWGMDEITVWMLRLLDPTWDEQEALIRLQIDIAIARKAIVLFAAGNGQRGWPGSMPEVISVGGVYVDEDGSLSASDYASSFGSWLYPFRYVPDVCGVVGRKPHGILIEMPTQPESELDKSFSGTENIGVDTDGTASDDGWLVASGTSSATPQVAGVAALLKQTRPHLDQVQVRDILQRTATDVISGCSAMGDCAGPGWDKATGYGLVNATRAISEPVPSDIFFQDDFNDGNADGWTVIEGTWEVEDGAYKGSGVDARSIAGDWFWADYIYEGKFKFDPFDPDDEREATVLFRVQGASPGENQGRYYQIAHHPGPSLPWPIPNVILFRVGNGLAIPLDGGRYNLTSGTWYNFKLVIVGETLRYYINDDLVLEREGLNDYPNGKIGVKAYRSTAYFDDIVVRSPRPRMPVILLPGCSASWNWGLLLDLGIDTGWTWALSGWPIARESWAELIKALEDVGYERDINYFVAFYDWRKNNDWEDEETDKVPREYLMETIDEARSIFEAQYPDLPASDFKVSVIAHSLGGLVARSYVESPYYRGDVKQVIILGSPHNGVVDAYYAWEGGEIPPRGDMVTRFLTSLYLKFLQLRHGDDPYTLIHEHCKVAGNLLPVGYDYLERLDGTPIPWRSMKEVNHFLSETMPPDGAVPLFASKGVSLTVMASTGITTAKKLRVDTDTAQYDPRWQDGKPEVTLFGDGDGTVLTSSALIPDAQEVTFPSAQHGDLPNRAKREILERLGVEYPTLSERAMVSTALENILAIFPTSQVDVRLEDRMGNPIIGYSLGDPLGQFRVVLVPGLGAGSYSLIVTGLETGSYRLVLQLFEQDETITREVEGTTSLGAESFYLLTYAPGEPDPLRLVLVSARIYLPLVVKSYSLR